MKGILFTEKWKTCAVSRREAWLSLCLDTEKLTSAGTVSYRLELALSFDMCTFNIILL